jgi:hypothetical protein
MARKPQPKDDTSFKAEPAMGPSLIDGVSRQET